MGRHHQHASARGARVSLGGATLAGLVCSAAYALAAPVAAPAAVSTPVAPAPTTTCDLDGPPVFGDPAHPDEITNRDCGYVDAQGRQRSHDAWIDDQLTAVR
jgi:hypothetical protein